MAIVIGHGLPVGLVGDYRLPIICYSNLLEQGVVVGNPVLNAANAWDWLTHDAWTTNAVSGTLTLTLASSAPADYFAFFSHDLHDNGGSIKLEYKQGAGAWTDVPGTTTIPGDNKPTVVFFDRISADQWRVSITCTTAVALGVVSFGLKMQLERGAYVGFTPPRFARRDKMLNAGSQDGHTLGRSLIRTGVVGKLALSNLTAAWVRATLEPFLLHARTKMGWFLVWNPDRLPDEVVYAWTTSMPQPTNTGSKRMGVTIAYEGRII